MSKKSEEELDEEWFNEWLDEHCEKQTQDTEQGENVEIESAYIISIADITKETNPFKNHVSNFKNDVNDNGDEYLTKKGAEQWAFIWLVVLPFIGLVIGAILVHAI